MWNLPWCWIVEENLLDVLDECAWWGSCAGWLDSADPGSACTCDPDWKGCGCTRPVTGGLWCCVLRELLLLLPGCRSAKALRGVYFPEALDDVAPSAFALGGSGTPWNIRKIHYLVWTSKILWYMILKRDVWFFYFWKHKNKIFLQII